MYDEKVKKRLCDDSQDDSDDEKLPSKKQGWPLLLGDSLEGLDLKLQQYSMFSRLEKGEESLPHW